MNVRFTSKFKRAIKRMAKRGKSVQKIDTVSRNIYYCKLHERHRDHALKGKHAGKRSCHIEPDWILIYKIIDNTLYLIDTGTHTDLYGM